MKTHANRVVGSRCGWSFLEALSCSYDEATNSRSCCKQTMAERSQNGRMLAVDWLRYTMRLRLNVCAGAVDRRPSLVMGDSQWPHPGRLVRVSSL